MKLTLTSNKDQPVIRVDSRVVHEYGTVTYSVVEFTAEDLLQLNDFAATCPTFKAFVNKPFPTIAIFQLNN